MSRRYPGQVSHGRGRKAESPAINVKHSSVREFCSTSSFQDSGHHELSESRSFDNKEFIGKNEKEPTLIYEHLETSGPGLTKPLESPAQRNVFVSPRKGKDQSPELCDTPKIRRKRCLLRRRLDLSFPVLKGDLESHGSSLDSGASQVLNVEKHSPSSASGFPRQNNFNLLVSSTIKTEEVISNSQNKRLNFSESKTSTIDDCKDDCGLFEVECISPIRGNSFKDSITHDFSDSSLSVNDENTHGELLSSVGSGTTYGTDENVFVTPVSNLVAKINFNASQTLSPPSAVRGNISTPEDSGFSSLSWDKSEDSLSDQEGSFQELLQKHKGTPRAGDTIKKPRHLGRSRRLSTLREQGSQSETEEDKETLHASADTLGVSESQLSSATKSEVLTVSFENLSRTPALQLVHELFMQSKRKRFQQKDAHEFLEESDEGKIAILQCVLAGLIGKKMGIEQLDILTELKYRNLKHILAMILDSLTAESLYSVWKVSRNWREIIAQDKKANQRRKYYITQLTANSEGALLNVQDASTRLHLLNRSALRSVQAQARAPAPQKEQSPTLSPWGEVLTPGACSSIAHSGSKQERFVRVARTLFTDEALKPCPRCQSPARYQPYKKRGLCSRKACGFDFCVSCLCAYHGSEDCSKGTAKPRNSKGALPGSAQSKRNLRRL
uniref:F-box only protein 43 n=1 Tax=Jaculus jaculus TaxID=51337 RepID=UPI001E1B216C|nr:F-box only protein 43 [Jaculus jaculus]